MIKFSFSIVFLFIVTLVFSQDKLLLEKLSSSKGKERVSVLIELGRSKDVSTEQAFDYLQEALDYAKANNLHESEISVRANYGIFLSDLGRYSEGLKYSIESFQILENYKLKNFNTHFLHLAMALNLEGLGATEAAIEERKKILASKLKFKDKFDFNYYFLRQNIATLYLKLDKIDSALVYFNAAGVDAHLLNKPKLIAGSSNDLGLTYFKIGKIDKALGYFNEAVSSYSGVAMNANDSLLLGVINGNIARCLPVNDPRIQSHFDFFLAMIEKYGNVSEKSDGYHHLSMYYSKKGNKQKAIDFSLKTLNLLAKEKNEYINFKLVALMDLYNLYLKDNQSAKANTYMQKYLKLYDNTYGKKAINDLLKTHSNYELSKIKQELLIENIKTQQHIETLSKEKEISSLRVTILIVGIIFITIISILLFLRYKNNSERKRKSQELENKLLEIENNQQSERLTHSVLSLQRKKDFTEEIIERLSELPSIDRKDLNDIKFFISNEVNIDESIIEMENYISETGKEFFIKLDLVHPGLTDYEQKLIALIRMNLSIKQIAIIKNITPQSVKIAKNRLSKKLELEPGSNIYDYLMSL